MVYFSCSGCNESLKKPKVAKHLQCCRRCYSLTCLDCQKEFSAQSYTLHTSCVSELEKYSGPNYVESANTNKGQKKQGNWMDSVREAISAYKKEPCDSTERKQVRVLLSGLLRYDNIPRKKAKFENFVRSSFGQFRREAGIINAAWEVISPSKSPANVQQQHVSDDKVVENMKQSPENVDQEQEDAHDKKKKKKRKRENCSDDETGEACAEKDEETGEVCCKKAKLVLNAEVNSHEVDEEMNVESAVEERRKKKKRKKKKSEEEEEEATEDVTSSQTLAENGDGAESNENDSSKFVVRSFVTTLLQRKGKDGLSMKKLEKRVVREYLRSFSRPDKEPRPERVRSKLKIIVSKHFRQIDDRVYEREGV